MKNDPAPPSAQRSAAQHADRNVHVRVGLDRGADRDIGIARVGEGDRDIRARGCSVIELRFAHLLRLREGRCGGETESNGYGSNAFHVYLQKGVVEGPTAEFFS